jgi:hypothetical protein
VLYYALTTGAALQTLGEEYCDLLQITGLLAGCLGLVFGHIRENTVMADAACSVNALLNTGGMPMEPSAARRAVLVALQSLAPYCMARWAPAPPDREDSSSSWRDDNPAMSPTSTTAQDAVLPPLPHQHLWQQVSTLVFAALCISSLLCKPNGRLVQHLQQRYASCTGQGAWG